MELTSVHECLKAAEMERSTWGPIDSVINVRIQEELKERAQKICERHNTNLSTYLRKCCEGLVADYTPLGKTKR